MPRPAIRPCGTVAAYNRHRVRGEDPCDACREAKRLRSEEDRLYGRRVREAGSELVDADPVRCEVAAALDRGASRLSIARTAGVGYSTLTAVLRGQSRRTTRARADAIIAACRADQRDGEPQPVDLAAGLLRVLIDQGATWRWLADELETSAAQVSRLVHRRQPTVQARTLERVETLAREVLSGDKHPPRLRDRHRERCHVEGCTRLRQPRGVKCRACQEGKAPRRAA